MEMKIGDLTIGFMPQIDYSVIEDHTGNHIASFRIMQTPDMTSLVIVYTWVDSIAMVFNDREEAFYIDGINPENYEQAKKIILDVFSTLNKTFNEDPYQNFDLESYIKNNLIGNKK